MDEQTSVVDSGTPKGKASWDKASFFVLVAALFLSPLFFWPAQTFPFQFGKAYLAIGATILAAIIWIVGRLRAGSIVLPYHAAFFGGAGVIIALFLSTIFSIGVKTSLLGNGSEITTFGFLTIMFVLTFLVFWQNRTKDRIFYTYLALFASFLILAVFHLLRLAFGADFLSFGIFTSAISNTVGKWNDLGIIFGLGAILSLITIELVSVKQALQWALYAVLTFSMLFLVLVNFTSVWVAVALFALMLFLYEAVYARKEGGEGEKKMLPITPLVVFLIAAILVIPVGRVAQSQSLRTVGMVLNDRIAPAFNILHLEVRPTWGSTYDVTKAALATDPVFGVGPNHFMERWLQHKPAAVNNTPFWNADFAYGIGLLPTLFATTGLLGVLSWVIFLGLFLYAGFRAVFSRIADSFSRYLVFSSFFSALFLWLFAFLYVPSIVPVFLCFIFTGIFFGSLAQAGLLKTKEFVFVDNPRAGFATMLILVFVLVLSVVTLYVYTSKFSSAKLFQQGVYAFNVQGNVAEAEAYFQKAVEKSSLDTYYRFLSELSLIKMNNLLSQPAAQTTQQAAQQELMTIFGQAKQYAESAVDASGTNYQNWLALGRVYEALVPLKLDGAYGLAVASYDNALTWNPRSPEIYLTRARLEVANGDRVKAREYVGKALEQKNNYTEAVFFLSQIEVAEGNLPQAIKSVEASIFLSPQEPVLYFQLGILKYNTKDYKGAVEALEQATLLNRDYANARYFLGLSYDRLGRSKDAVAQFEDILRMNPGNEEVKSIIDNLSAGRAPFTNAPTAPERRGTLPVTDPQEAAVPADE